MVQWHPNFRYLYQRLRMGLGDLYFNKQTRRFCCRWAGGLAWRDVGGNFGVSYTRV